VGAVRQQVRFKGVGCFGLRRAWSVLCFAPVRLIFVIGMMVVVGATGCGIFSRDKEDEKPLEFSRENYTQTDENGSAVFTLSDQGKLARAGKVKVAKPKKKPWWKFW